MSHMDGWVIFLILCGVIWFIVRDFQSLGKNSKLQSKSSLSTNSPNRPSPKRNWSQLSYPPPPRPDDAEKTRVEKEKVQTENAKEEWRQRIRKEGYDPEAEYRRMLRDVESVYETPPPGPQKQVEIPSLSKPQESTKANGNKSRHISTEVKRIVWERDEGKCVYCGSTEGLHFDHVIPLAKGGGNTEKNIQLLCQNCNLKKGDKIV